MKSDFKISQVVLTFVLLGVLSLGVGCGPSVKGDVQIPDLTALKDALPRPLSGQGAMVYVEDFRDGRSIEPVASFKEKDLLAEGELLQPVQKVVKEHLESIGFEVSASGAVVLAGEVKKWFAAVSGGVPGSIDSEAVVSLEVYDPTNKKIYSGEYQGFANVQKTGIDNGDVKEALETAMLEALKQFASDKQLINVLKSF